MRQRSTAAADRSRLSGESPGDRGQVADGLRELLHQGLRDDDGRALLPPARAWLWPAEPVEAWRESDVLAFWCVSVPLAPPKERDRIYAAEREWARGRIIAALTASTKLKRAEATLERQKGHPACPPAALEGLRDRVIEATRRRSALFAEILERGLHHRLGLPLRPLAIHELAYEWIADRSSETSPGAPVVCESCSVVFQTARKHHAWRCPACHHSPQRRAPLSVSINRRGGIDIAGPGGELMHRSTSCIGCGAVIESQRLDRAYCSDSCRKRIERGGVGVAFPSAPRGEG